MSLSLPPELGQFVEQELASGRFRNADEVICEALRLLRERERKLDLLRLDIDAGLDQIENGESVLIENDNAHAALFEEIKTRARVLHGARDVNALF